MTTQVDTRHQNGLLRPSLQRSVGKNRELGVTARSHTRTSAQTKRTIQMQISRILKNMSEPHHAGLRQQQRRRLELRRTEELERRFAQPRSLFLEEYEDQTGQQIRHQRLSRFHLMATSPPGSRCRIIFFSRYLCMRRTHFTMRT